MTEPGDHPSGRPERLSENALQRRVKRWWLNGPYEAHLQAPPGLEELLAHEVADLGFAQAPSAVEVERGGVNLALDPAEVMRANLSSRLASRVLVRLGEFPGSSVEMLYDRSRKLPWEAHLGFNDEYELHVTSRSSRLEAGEEVAKAISSGVSRRMRELGLFPKRESGAPLKFHARLFNDYCTVSLNSSGEHLHRRGVRRHVHGAPLRENLAAAMVRLGLEGGPGQFGAVVDPFCGSGTLLIEAADALHGLEPGRGREFAFEHAAWFRPGRWREVKREAARSAEERRERGGELPLFGYDIDPRALAAARLNLAPGAGASSAESEAYGSIRLAEADAERLDLTALGVERGLILSNLPYGVRLGDARRAADTTRRFLAQLAMSGASWRVVLMGTEQEANIAAQLMDVTRTFATRNGGLAVTLLVGEVGG